MRKRKGILMVALAISLVFAGIPAFAADAVTDENLGSIALNETLNAVTGQLDHTGDTATYTVTVDHSIVPQITVFARSIGNQTGNARIEITDEAGNLRSQMNLSAKIEASSNLSTSTNTYPKLFSRITDEDGATKTYTITVTATTDGAAYEISVGTIDDLTAALGGIDHVAVVGKNEPTIAGPGYILGYAALLNGEGDYYKYTATGDGITYVGLRYTKSSNIAFQVIDAETGQEKYTSSSSDVYASYHADVLSEYVAQKRLLLEPGRDYYIKMYSPTGVYVDNVTQRYYAYIGLPSVQPKTVTYTYPKSYSIQANKLTTFEMDLSGFSNYERLQPGGYINFVTNTNTKNVSINYCRITAPNGKTFNGTYGKCPLDNYVLDYNDFLENDANIPLNGRWKVTIRASESLSGLQLKFICNSFRLQCNEPEDL